jgi:hypothetical protein
MFDSITATSVVAAATSWATELYPIVLLVIGLGLFLALANWVIAKIVRRGGGGSRRRGAKARA